MAKPPAINLGKNMDHPHLKGRFTLRIWVPVEQAGLVGGQSGEIKRQASVRSIDCPVRSGEACSPPSFSVAVLPLFVAHRDVVLVEMGRGSSVPPVHG